MGGRIAPGRDDSAPSARFYFLTSCFCSCLIDEAAANDPEVLAKHRTTPFAIVTFARWGPGRHLAGTAARTVHRVQSERAQCVL